MNVANFYGIATSLELGQRKYVRTDVVADCVAEAIEALTALGYSSTEARNAVSQVRDQSDKPEDLIRLALRAMAGM